MCREYKLATQQAFQPVNQHEQFFDCPHCGEYISILLDLSVQQQHYIEDCEVCCAPIEISYNTFDGELVNYTIER